MEAIILSRTSALARVQARIAENALVAAAARLGAPWRFVLAAKRSEGDDTQGALTQAGGKALFTRALDQAVLGGEARFSVHSAKDIPEPVEPGIVLAAVLARGNPLDVLLRRRRDLDSTTPLGLAGLPKGAVVATSAPRRQAFVLAAGHRVAPLRGNVLTRLERFASGEGENPAGAAAAIILAASGLERLELVPPLQVGKHYGLAGGLVAEALPPADFLPAAGQGAIGICVAEGDEEALAVARLAESETSRRQVDAERSVLSALQANCHTAVGAFARMRDNAFVLSATLAHSFPDIAPEQAGAGVVPTLHHLETTLAGTRIEEEPQAHIEAGARLGRELRARKIKERKTTESGRAS